MNFGQAPQLAAREQDKAALMPQMVETFQNNLERMHSNISRIEDQLHSILNLRSPTPTDEKSETPMESDLANKMGNRFGTMSILNDRLDQIVAHLNKIVG